MKIKKAVLNQIDELFVKAEGYSKNNIALSIKCIKKAKQLAMHSLIKTPKELKKKYCHHCFSYFTAKNSKIRIKKGFRVVYCLKCRHYQRTKLS